MIGTKTNNRICRRAVIPTISHFSRSFLVNQHYGLLWLCMWCLFALLCTPYDAFEGVGKGGNSFFLRNRARNCLRATGSSSIGWDNEWSNGFAMQLPIPHIPLFANSDDPVRGGGISLASQSPRARTVIAAPTPIATICSCRMGETIVHCFKTAAGLPRDTDRLLHHEEATAGELSTTL